MQRTKKRIPELLPTKKWLETPEACAYMNMSMNHFLAFAIDKKLTVSCPFGKKKYYRVAELDRALEEGIIHRQTA